LKLIISWKRCYLFLCFAYSFQTAVNYVKWVCYFNGWICSLHLNPEYGAIGVTPWLSGAWHSVTFWCVVLRDVLVRDTPWLSGAWHSVTVWCVSVRDSGACHSVKVWCVSLRGCLMRVTP
jgi:hypothetical protein